MAELGTFALLSALVVAVFGVAAGVISLRRNNTAFLAASQRAMLAWAALIALAGAVLMAALLTRQFRFEFVALTTSRDLSWLYTAAAFWGGHAGSLLLWALILGLYGVAAVRSLRAYPELSPVATIVFLVIAGFFSALLVFAGSPFTLLQVPPPDGRGLNPLLLNPWMAVHPPTLYLGFVGMTVPFALAIAALVSGRLDQVWIVLARRWVLTAWMFLTLGLLFGAKWSYVVLGWGGYWAWDPVENAALMPWLTSTAFLHSIQVAERRGLLATWTVALIIITFSLSIFGTFLTRSGILSSVHTFANSSIGLYFLTFLAVVLVTAFGLLLWRLDVLQSGGRLESVLSRESAFLLNNVLFVTAAFVVFFGTVFPMLAEAVTGDRIAVGPPYFTQVLSPIVLMLLALMGIGPLLAWRRSGAQALTKAVAAPAALAVLAGVGLLAAGMRAPGAVAIFVLCVFSGCAVGVEFAQGVRVRRRHGEGALFALMQLIDRNRRRYGGYVVHLGILLILAGITASSAFATQLQTTLAPGQSARLSRYIVRYDGLASSAQPGIEVTTAALTVFTGGRDLGPLRVRHLFHLVQGQPTAEVGLRSTLRDDLYVVLVAVSPDQQATFRILVNPMVSWIWIGGGVILVGALVTLAPMRRRHEERRPTPLPETLLVPQGEAPAAGGGES